MTFVVLAGGTLHNLKQQQKQRQRQNLVDHQTKNPICSGVLRKRSKWLHMWNQRYVQLTKNYILTFQKGSKEGTHKTSPTGMISLKSIQSVRKTQVQKGPQNSYFFHFYGQDQNEIKLNYYFACKSEEQRNKWIKFIKQNCPKLKNKK